LKAGDSFAGITDLLWRKGFQRSPQTNRICCDKI